MKLAALCCTYLRPELLGELIESFRRQDYPLRDRELIVLDDAGQYECHSGDGWKVISISTRFHTLGEKRNACAALASPDAEGFLVADDDDIYLPHWFETQAQALRQADFSRPSRVLIEEDHGLVEHDTSGLYHGGWAIRRSAFYGVAGYRAVNNGEDQDLAARLHKSGVTEIDPCNFASPFYVYRVNHGSFHVSYLSDRDYQKLGQRPRHKSSIRVGWSKGFDRLPRKCKYSLGAKVERISNGLPVELIGPVESAGRNGPTNGMFALQRALKCRIAQGLDWLSIRPLPASDGALAWFWNWDDRGYANWWDRSGRPYVEGPNMLFINSARPRIDVEEQRLLDAANCRSMFCHTAWYRDRIAQHRSPCNQCPIELWPYPIDPWPDGPMPDEFDLLIYAKNGHRPQLLEHLAAAFPRHIQIHYGKYAREELYNAARKSRACAYLADDDHGPLALQEILLAGCPTVGVRTGASFVRPGETGVWVERLPPGQACVRDEQDELRLRLYLKAIAHAQAMDRNRVREIAAADFDTDAIVDRLVAILDRVRCENAPAIRQ
jgi:hypothetical protein